MTVVIDAPDPPELDRFADGSVSAVIGCIDTGDGLVQVMVAGQPLVIDLVVEEPLAEDDGEGLRDTLNNIVAGRRTVAGIGLDHEAAQGLIRLLTRAIAVRESTAAEIPGSTAEAGGGTVPL